MSAPDLAVGIGLIGLAIGLGMIYFPAALIAVSGLILLIGLRAERR
jgi:hypothetical protein